MKRKNQVLPAQLEALRRFKGGYFQVLAHRPVSILSKFSEAHCRLAQLSSKLRVAGEHFTASCFIALEAVGQYSEKPKNQVLYRSKLVTHRSARIMRRIF